MGSRGLLPAPRPLRTGLDSFPSSGSSLSNAPWWDALAETRLCELHDKHLLPSNVSVNGRTSQTEVRRHLLSRFDGLSSYLVTRDPAEVCSLSRGVMLPPARARNPYPTHYRSAFAFSAIPYPQTHRHALRLAFPSE